VSGKSFRSCRIAGPDPRIPAGPDWEIMDSVVKMRNQCEDFDLGSSSEYRKYFFYTMLMEKAKR
jgi:hypothetical protein